MSGYLNVLLIALLPLLGNFSGAVLAESMRVPPWAIGAALHAAAGIAIAVVSVDLMPRVLQVLPMWLTVLAFVGGALFSILIARGVQRLRRMTGGGASHGAWMVFMAVGADLFSDGMMTGAGSAVSRNLGLLLALSQTVANMPGGFAAAANLRDEGIDRRRRLLMSGAMLVPVFAGASAGFWLLRGAGELLENAALAFIVGVLLLATVEDMVPQADEPEAVRWITTTAFTAGFAFFALLSSYLS